MDDRAALLAAVCDRPDDDTPRLVYADWCDDHGDPDHARFVRAQVELARVPEWDRRAFRSGLTFRRGFPWGVECADPQAFADSADELFAAAPIQSLTVRSEYRQPPPDITPLIADPRMSRLRRLVFRLSRLGTDAVRRLAESPHLTGVTELSFEFGGITPDGVTELFRSGLPGRLIHLRFHQTGAVPVMTLGGYGRASALRSLTVTNAGLSGLHLTEMFSGPLFRGLVELDLAGNSLGPVGIANLAASPAATTLESLTLLQTAPGVPGVRALAASPAVANLRRLDLRGCGLGPIAVKAVAQSPHLANLSVLDLSGNEIGDKGALALAESPYLRDLAGLDLTSSGLTDRGITALLDSGVTANLEQLGVAGNVMSPAVRARVRERFG